MIYTLLAVFQTFSVKLPERASKGGYGKRNICASCSQTTSSEQERKEREETHLCAGDGDAADVRVGF